MIVSHRLLNKLLDVTRKLCYLGYISFSRNLLNWRFFVLIEWSAILSRIGKYSSRRFICCFYIFLLGWPLQTKTLDRSVTTSTLEYFLLYWVNRPANIRAIVFLSSFIGYYVGALIAIAINIAMKKTSKKPQRSRMIQQRGNSHLTSAGMGRRKAMLVPLLTFCRACCER